MSNDSNCNSNSCHRDPNQEYDPDAGVNPDPNNCTLCTGDTSDNIFFVPRAPGYPPKCVLDELTYSQVWILLQRVPKAKSDLLRITDDPILVRMAESSKLVESPHDEDERMRKKLHENSLPMYTVLKGNIDGSL
jgi:hypothetical protein